MPLTQLPVSPDPVTKQVTILHRLSSRLAPFAATSGTAPYRCRCRRRTRLECPSSRRRHEPLDAVRPTRRPPRSDRSASPTQSLRSAPANRCGRIRFGSQATLAVLRKPPDAAKCPLSSVSTRVATPADTSAGRTDRERWFELESCPRIATPLDVQRDSHRTTFSPTVESSVSPPTLTRQLRWMETTFRRSVQHWIPARRLSARCIDVRRPRHGATNHLRSTPPEGGGRPAGPASTARAQHNAAERHVSLTLPSCMAMSPSPRCSRFGSRLVSPAARVCLGAGDPRVPRTSTNPCDRLASDCHLTAALGCPIRHALRALALGRARVPRLAPAGVAASWNRIGASTGSDRRRAATSRFRRLCPAA